jgi:hypothetical protein
MYRVPNRLYRTVDGRLVGHNDPEAAFLAFPAGMELSDEEAQRFGLIPPEEKPEEKKTPRPADKMAARPRDKAVARTDAKEQAHA